VHVAVQMRNGRTTIRIAETLRALRGSVFGGGVGGFGGGFGGPLFAMVSSATGGVELGFAAALTAVATAYFGTRAVYKGIVKSRQTELRGLIARLAEEARQSIAEPSEEGKRPVLPRR
jgi:hypothetical protein